MLLGQSKVTLQELKKKYNKTFFIIYQEMDEVSFKKVVNADTSKEAWVICIICAKGQIK